MERELSFCIWGCGIRGKNIYRYMKGRGIRAFIDQNPAFHGTTYEGVPIISLQEFLEDYADCIVIATPFARQWEVKCLLEKNQIHALFSAPLPPELFETYVPRLFDIVDGKISGSGTVYLYGLDLYSILLYEYYQEKGRKAKIIPESGSPLWLREQIAACKPDCIGQLDEVGTSCLYVTSKKNMKDIHEGMHCVGIYDLMVDISEHYNPQIETFKGIHAGRRCFIIATGPSLRIDDLEMLHKENEICISMNGIIKIYPKTKWRPDYYLIEDMYCFQEWKKQLLGDGKIKNMLVADLCRAPSSEKEFIKYHVSLLQIERSVPTDFSENFAFGAYHGMTVTYDCLQFAAYLGCKEIYLYGLDHNWTRQYNHFTEDYYSLQLEQSAANETWDRDLIENSYRSALLAAKRLGIKIYNASRETKLEIFERVDFDSIFYQNH